MSSLHSLFWGSFAFCSGLCVLLQIVSRAQGSTASKQSAATNSKFFAFQMNYLFVFMLAMFSDWLQGPYVYELYVSYGFTTQEIAELFVCGFGSSMIVGTYVGGLADKWGRKNMCILYSVCYIIACFTKLVPEYWTLMLGRFLSGISTSLLFSVFESWMVCEHFKQGFDASQLNDTFAYATFGNGLMAVLAGLVANAVADKYGFTAPFMVALAPLTVSAGVVAFTWTENYGNQSVGMVQSLTRGFELIRNDAKIAALGIGQSCFEGAMYTFVFMWTPALKRPEDDLITKEPTTSQYLGVIFAVFMVCVMAGSSIFKIVSNKKENLLKVPLYLHAVAFASMAVTTVYLENKTLVYYMFLIFECTVGLFYPSYGVIKSERIPEDVRSTVMNIFRIPLNGFVVLLLLKIKYLSSGVVFGVCTGAHALAFLSYVFFYNAKGKGGKAESMFDDTNASDDDQSALLNA